MGRYLENNVWVNSGWQCYDRFNDTQGDPPSVLKNVGAIRQRFNMSIALHWYEWQCGFDNLCVKDQGKIRYKFDTEYPDYFPARRGDGFREAVDALHAQGVYTFPYINGRIFDNNSRSFVNDHGEQYIVKQYTPPSAATYGDTSQLTECKEAYGSKELDGQLVYFDVADPTTEYWQDKYASHVERLVNESHVGGVYIDQLCAGSPLPDFTPGRTHRGGGGAWWRQGLVQLLRKAHARSKVDGRWSPLVVESNSEFLMDVANGLLTLVAFGVPFAEQNPPPAPAQAPTAQSVAAPASILVPAFPAVYGGYFVGFGSIYTHNDLALDANVLASRMAASFVYGIQIGWFSLQGVDHGPDLDTRCGPMYTQDLWMMPKHDPEVAFLQLLARSRGSMARYFVHGSLAQPVEVSPTPRTFMAPVQQIMPRNPGPFPTLSSAVWRTHNLSSVCVFLVSSTQASVDAAFTMDMRDYGFDLAQQHFVVELVTSEGSRSKVATVVDGVVVLKRKIAGRSVEMLEVTPTTEVDMK